jgi:hypothetical protein
MKNKIMSTLFGMALLMVGACSQNNGQAVAQQGNNLPFAKEIGDSNGYIIRRFVDCDAKTFVYTVNGAISVISSHQLSRSGASYLYKFCGEQ